MCGRYSKRKRQIDIYLVENTPAGRVRTVIDTKHFSRSVNVKAVDGLVGFVQDVRADRGMLITNQGYSIAALRRAFYGPTKLELDVVSFAELEQFQGFGAIPYSGEKGFLVTAPFG
ncbi:MAG: restriction endonuclease, partial [Steroidobacteraceae bacterium]